MMWDFRYKAQGRVHKKLPDIFLRLFRADLGPPDASEGPNRGGVSLSLGKYRLAYAGCFSTWLGPCVFVRSIQIPSARPDG
jgi:hypothetical protein